MRRTALAAALVMLSFPLGLTFVGTSAARWHAGIDPQALAGEIPEPMLGAYLDAAATWEIDWALLGAIGKLECDHFRSRAPGCWPPGSINHAGARGPMQFLGSTWRASAERYDLDVSGPPVPDGHGYATDGDGDGIADPWNSYDAVHAAARYLVDLGGREDPHTAARHYNAGPANPNPAAGEGYATRVLELIVDYRALAGADGPGTPVGHAAAAAVFDGSGDGGCSLPDPTGTGGCVTPRTAHLVAQLRTGFGDLPMWCWDLRPGNPHSDHPHGRACDITFGAIGRFPTPAERADGWAVASWLVANAEALGVAYVIWDGRIWTARSGWRPYTGGGIYDPTDPTGGHFDHVHVSVQDELPDVTELRRVRLAREGRLPRPARTMVHRPGRH